jgi:hypothetical protein
MILYQRKIFKLLLKKNQEKIYEYPISGSGNGSGRGIGSHEERGLACVGQKLANHRDIHRKREWNLIDAWSDEQLT